MDGDIQQVFPLGKTTNYEKIYIYDHNGLSWYVAIFFYTPKQLLHTHIVHESLHIIKLLRRDLTFLAALKLSNFVLYICKRCKHEQQQFKIFLKYINEMDKIGLATELTQLCLVPELRTGIDDQQVESAHFKEFKEILNTNLHLLFDLLQQYESVLFDNIKETRVFRKNFVLLLCEQSAQNVPYKTDQVILQQNITHLVDKWFSQTIGEKCIFELVLQHYKTLLKVDSWKKNIGSVFGFHRFCQIYYKSNVLHLNEVFFTLATGTLLLEHYEPMYKELGIDIYLVLLTFSNKSDLLTTNIHHAIYATCSPNIPKIQDHQINVKLWQCMYKCLVIDDSWKRTSDWHKVDELMMDLLKRIAFEGNICKSTVLFYYAAKFGSLPNNTNSLKNQFSHFSETDGMNRIASSDVDWNHLRNEYQKCDSFIIYKWVKKMLLLIGNQNMFYGKDFEVASNIQAIHLTYIVWIYSIPVTLISSPILDMLTKFIPTLMECYQRYKVNELVCSQIRQLFTTFLEHFKSTDVSSNIKYVNLQKRFETLQLIKDAVG